jgi:hypothetical protein
VLDSRRAMSPRRSLGFFILYNKMLIGRDKQNIQYTLYFGILEADDDEDIEIGQDYAIIKYTVPAPHRGKSIMWFMKLSTEHGATTPVVSGLCIEYSTSGI